MSYNRVNWKNGASGCTPLGATNLNVMDEGIATLDEEKFDKSGGTITGNVRVYKNVSIREEDVEEGGIFLSNNGTIDAKELDAPTINVGDEDADGKITIVESNMQSDITADMISANTSYEIRTTEDILLNGANGTEIRNGLTLDKLNGYDVPENPFSGGNSDSYSRVYAEGTNGTLTDSDNGKLKDLKVYGACEQGENPTPENPQVVKAVVNPKVEIRNANLWDEQTGFYSYDDANGILTPVPTSGQGCLGSANYIPIEPNKDYRINTDGTNAYIYWYDKDKNFVGGYGANIYGAYKTSPENAYYMRFYIGGAYGKTYKNDVMVAQSQNLEEYVTPQKKSVTLNGITLYGIGSVKDVVDVEKGKIIRNIGVVDLGTLSWAYETWEGHPNFTTNGISTSAKKPLATDVPNALCEDYKAVTFNQNRYYTNLGFSISATSCVLDIRDTIYTSASEFKTAMNGVKLYYELATPTEEDIPSTILAQLKALESYNPTTNVSVSSDQIDGTCDFLYALDFESAVNNAVGKALVIDSQNEVEETYIIKGSPNATVCSVRIYCNAGGTNQRICNYDIYDNGTNQTIYGITTFTTTYGTFAKNASQNCFILTKKAAVKDFKVFFDGKGYTVEKQ